MINSLLNISDLTRDQIIKILDFNSTNNSLSNKNIGLLFEKNSTRTRISFNVGINQLGGNCIDIRYEELNISRDESFEDTFRALNCYLDGLIFRTTDHNRLIEAKKYFKKPIINALSDISHPCQILSDLFTLKSHFKKLDLNLLWMGDMNNVCYSLVEAASLINELKLTICSPTNIINKKNWSLSSNVNIVKSKSELDLSKFNCVMTDVFVSMNDDNIEGKVDLLKPFSVDSNLMSKVDKHAVFMHCLPAKVGFEVTDDVFRSPQSIVWKQAYNRLIAQKKLLQFCFKKIL